MARPKKEDGTEHTTELTPEERALAARIASGDREWETITEESMGDFSLAEDPYKLPPEAAKQQAEKKFAFRWVEATPSRVDMIQSLDPPARWWICNATNTPFLEKHIDPAHGGIQKLDQLLMFKPWWMHERYQDAKMQIAKAKDRGGDITTRDGKKESYGEWKAGPEHKITGNDVIMASDETFEAEGE